MAIRAVFFDMGGTIETFSFNREMRLAATSGIQQRLLSVGIDLHLDNEQLYQVVSDGLKNYHQWRLTSLQELPVKRVWLEYILADYTVDPDAIGSIAEDLTFYIETQYYHRKMRPEVPAVLETIHNMGYKIGLISNVTSFGQVPTNLDLYHIRHYFNPIVLSSEYGRRKPDPAIFHYAARLANEPTSECLYIGDRITRDIVGARKAGYGMAVQILHQFAHGEEDNGATPDHVIHNMTDLVDILKNIQCETAKEFKNGNVRAIVFDAGDILYYRPRKGNKFKSFLQKLSISVDISHSPEKKALELKAYQGKIDRDQYRDGILRLYGITQTEQIEKGKKILEEEQNDIVFFKGVKNTLLALKKKGFLLAIVTDTAEPLSRKLSWFEQGGFGHIWDSLVSSQELGVRKPDPLIYRAALKQLGLPAEQTVFIGHKAYELEGARQLSMKTVAFNYEENALADYYIEKFSDLLNVPILSH